MWLVPPVPCVVKASEHLGAILGAHDEVELGGGGVEFFDIQGASDMVELRVTNGVFAKLA